MIKLFFIVLMLLLASSQESFASSKHRSKLHKITSSSTQYIEYYNKNETSPEISFEAPGGAIHNLEEFEGSVVLLVMWASWCQVCANEMPSLDLLQKRLLKKPIKIIPLSQDYKGMSKVVEFFEKYQLKYLDPYLDSKGEIFRELEVRNIPAAFVINADGNIVAKISGNIDWQSNEIFELLVDTSKDATRNYNKNPNKELEVMEKIVDPESKKEIIIPAAAFTNIN